MEPDLNGPINTSLILIRSLFLLLGVVGCIWYGFWLVLTFEKPAKHPTISQEELKYIEESIGVVAQTSPTVRIDP